MLREREMMHRMMDTKGEPNSTKLSLTECWLGDSGRWR